jgi:hypothetical protein
MQTTFIFQRNLHTNLNTCPTVSQVPGNLRRKILVVAVGIAQRHAILLWYTHSGAPPSCNSCSVSTVMRIPIVARHNKTR